MGDIHLSIFATNRNNWGTKGESLLYQIVFTFVRYIEELSKAQFALEQKNAEEEEVEQLQFLETQLVGGGLTKQKEVEIQESHKRLSILPFFFF